MPSLQTVLQDLHVHVIIDLIFEEKCDLFFDCKAQIHMSWTVIAWSLRDNWSHVKVVARKKYLHPSTKKFGCQSISDFYLLFIIETIIIVWVKVGDNTATFALIQVLNTILSKQIDITIS